MEMTVGFVLIDAVIVLLYVAWKAGSEMAGKLRWTPLVVALMVLATRTPALLSPPLPWLVWTFVLAFLGGSLFGLYHRHQSRLLWGLPGGLLGALLLTPCSLPFVLAGAVVGSETALERRCSLFTVAAVLLLPLLAPDKSGYLLLLPLVAAAVAARPLLR